MNGLALMQRGLEGGRLICEEEKRFEKRRGERKIKAIAGLE